MTANKPIFSRFSKRVFLPIWYEAHTSNDTGLPIATLLCSDTIGKEWKTCGSIYDSETWLIENTIVELNSG